MQDYEEMMIKIDVMILTSVPHCQAVTSLT